MKKIHVTLLMLACLALAFVACSSEEDTTPSNIEVNKFAPADNDHSELAEYRRDFHKNTGTYLLFDDRGCWMYNTTCSVPTRIATYIPSITLRVSNNKSRLPSMFSAKC